jgi:hypothetical protein
LFADPSLLYGVAHILDFSGTFTAYNHSQTELEADGKALYADWSSVGDELTAAINAFSAEQRGEAF